MKFEDAFDKIHEKHRLQSLEKGEDFAVNASSTKIMAFMWNMLVLSKNKLDDMVYLDENLNIVSFPIKQKEEPTEKKAKESGAKKTAKPKDKAVIDEQKEEPEKTE